MKVLWFSNSPSLAAEYLNMKSNTEGWISSLEGHIGKIDDIELGVAFPYDSSKVENFKIDNTSYFSYPLPKITGRINQIRQRWNHKTEDESGVNYFIDIVNKFNPDLIHIFGTELSFGLLIPSVKVPVVIQIQGNLTVVSKKWFSGVSFIDILRFSSFLNLIRAHGIWHYYFIFKNLAKRERKIFKNCKNFIGRTDWDNRIARILSPGSSYFHCDEMLREVFFQKSWNSPSNKNNLIFSTLKPHTYKGLETILETAAILKNAGYIDFQWRIAGVSGKEEIIGIIEKSYNLKFIDQNILFLGSITAEELVDALLFANCYIHPSHIENSPNSLCEAMLLGVPVISTYAGGIPSIVSNKNDGILVQDGDPYALAGAILEFAEDPEKAKMLGKNARTTALIRHNPQKIVKDLLDIYAKLISGNVQNKSMNN